MQDKKDLKDQHPAAGPGLEGARCVGSLRKGGKGEQGQAKGLLEAMRKFREKREGKKISSEAKGM